MQAAIRAYAEDVQRSRLVAHCHAGLAKLYSRTGKREQAQEHLTTASTMYREMGMTYWLEKAEAVTMSREAAAFWPLPVRSDQPAAEARLAERRAPRPLGHPEHRDLSAERASARWHWAGARYHQLGVARLWQQGRHLSHDGSAGAPRRTRNRRAQRRGVRRLSADHRGCPRARLGVHGTQPEQRPLPPPHVARRGASRRACDLRAHREGDRTAAQRLAIV